MDDGVNDPAERNEEPPDFKWAGVDGIIINMKFITEYLHQGGVLLLLFKVSTIPICL